MFDVTFMRRVRRRRRLRAATRTIFPPHCTPTHADVSLTKQLVVLFFLLRLFISFTPPNPTGCRSKKYEATSEFDYRLTGSGSRNLHFRSSAEIQLPK